MEPSSQRTSRSSLNVILRITDLCKLSSVGSLPINPKPINPKSTNPKEISNGKIHLSSSEEETILLKLLDSVSSLKLAYVQLQQAHVPYDPKKIKISDKFLSSQFESLCKLENLYDEKQTEKPKKGLNSLNLKTKEHEKLLVVLKSIIDDKESEIERLRSEFEELDRDNSELEEKVIDNKKKKSFFERRLNLANRELTPNLFCETVKFASRSIHNFAKPLISFMRVSGWDLDSAANSMHEHVVFHERSHKKYVFESYISQIMFASKQHEQFSTDQFDRVMGFEDSFEAIMSDPNSDFGLFCREKYLEIIPKEMEDCFFGNLDHRVFVKRGGHPKTPFYSAFVKMARWIWALRVMANTFIPKAEMYYVEEGASFDEDYMESVVNELANEEGELRVGFTVMPGFKIGETIARSRIYLSKSCENFEFNL